MQNRIYEQSFMIFGWVSAQFDQECEGLSATSRAQQPPCPRLGVMGCAASPTSVRQPRPNDDPGAVHLCRGGQQTVRESVRKILYHVGGKHCGLRFQGSMRDIKILRNVMLPEPGPYKYSAYNPGKVFLTDRIKRQT